MLHTLNIRYQPARMEKKKGNNHIPSNVTNYKRKKNKHFLKKHKQTIE